MKTTRTLSLALALLLPALAAPVPNDGVVTYSGYLRNSAGNAETTPQNLVFTLWDASTAGNTVWTQTVNGVQPDSAGWFSVVLGASPAAFPPGEFLSQSWLGVKVGSEAEMAPRTKVGVAPAALSVEYAGLSGCGAAGNQILQWNGSAWSCTVPVVSLPANPTFTGTVTAPTFAGNLSGNASSATTASGVAANVVTPSGLNAASTPTAGQVPARGTTDTFTWVSPLAPPPAACGPGQVLTWTSGLLTCVADANTTYTAGAGLTLTGTQFAPTFTTSGGYNGATTTVARGDHVHPGLVNAIAPALPPFTTLLDNAVHNLMSITVTCPAAGQVLLVASGNSAFYAQGTVVYIGISTSATVLASFVAQGWLGGTATLVFQMPFSHNALLPGVAGNNTFYLNAQRDPLYPLGQVNVDPKSFVAVCIRN